MESDMKSVVSWMGIVLAFVSANAAVTVDLSSAVGAVKPMNAVGDGPVLGRPDGEAAENTGNSELFRALEIPFCRTHDSNSCMIYGSPCPFAVAGNVLRLKMQPRSVALIEDGVSD